MAKREWPLRFTCKHPGCTDSTTFRYDTRRERSESWELRTYGGGNGWACVRHSNPERVLSAENPETRFEVASLQREYGRFFGNQGLVTGPGFLAYAKDFPEGTKLIITARIEFPEAPHE